MQQPSRKQSPHGAKAIALDPDKLFARYRLFLFYQPDINVFYDSQLGYRPVGNILELVGDKDPPLSAELKARPLGGQAGSTTPLASACWA